MEFPGDLRYTKDHEWIRKEKDGATVGITEFAQSELGEVVFVELPEVGREISRGEAFAVVESTKAASDVYAPVSGRVVEINTALNDSPDLVNSSPYDDGWMVKLADIQEGELAELMDASEYRAIVEG